MPIKRMVIFSSFLINYFLKVHLHLSSKIKSKKNHKLIKVFLTSLPWWWKDRIRNRKNNDESGPEGLKTDPTNPDRLHWLLLIRIHDTPRTVSRSIMYRKVRIRIIFFWSTGFRMMLQCGQCCGSGCDEVWQCYLSNHHMLYSRCRFYYFLLEIKYQYNFYCDGFTVRIRVRKLRMRRHLSTSTYRTVHIL